MPLEVIIVNNKSTDNTATLVNDFIAEYTKEHPNHKGIIKLIDQNAEQGLIPTRNLGFNTAEGDILARIDADAILSHDWVSAVINAFSDTETYGVTGPVTYYDMPMRRFSYKQDARIRKLIIDKANDFPMMFGTNMAIRKTAWEKLSDQACLDPEDILHEDVDLSIHLALNGMKVKYVEDMLVGMSARRIENKYKDFREYQERMLTTYKMHNISPTISAKAARIWFLTIWFPLHLIRPTYVKRFERLRDEYLSNLWDDGGKMDTFMARQKSKFHKS